MQYLMLLLLYLTTTVVQAQLQLTPNIFDENHTNLDFENEFIYIEMDATIASSASTIEELGWAITNQDHPEQWNITVSTPLTTYSPLITQGFEPLTILPNSSDYFFDIDLYPYATAGCGSFDIIFYQYDAPAIIYDTVSYHIRINQEDCLSTAVKPTNISINHHKLAPNPATSSIHLHTTDNIRKARLLDITGQIIQELPTHNIHHIDISSLSPGVYYLQLINHELQQQTLRWIKL